MYRVVQENLETFLAEVEAGSAASLPQFVKDEFDAFLECGILAHGFLLALLAVVVFFSDPLGVIGVALYVAWTHFFQILPEERALAARFGTEFEDYCRRVRRWL